jgi:hypothetical protein
MIMIKPASPLPWKEGNVLGIIQVIEDANGCAVEIYSDQNERPYIITACNSYPDLVEALLEAKIVLVESWTRENDKPAVNAAIDKINAALKKAGME